MNKYLRGRDAFTPLEGWVIRLTLCRFEAVSSRKVIKSLGPLRCSRVKCPAISSVTRFGSPPGKDAQTGHICKAEKKIL